MTLLRHYDEITGTVGCAGHDGNCECPAVQTIRMACVPYSQEGDQIKRGSVRYEYVGVCEGHWKAHFPARAKWIPQRFVDGVN